MHVVDFLQALAVHGMNARTMRTTIGKSEKTLIKKRKEQARAACTGSQGARELRV